MDAINTTKRSIDDLLVKKPFVRILPDGYHSQGFTIDPNRKVGDNHEDILRYKIVTQGDFLREYDPAGHSINDRTYYPDIWRQDPESGKWYVEELPRHAFAYQSVITCKHLAHLCGNDIQFELTETHDNQNREDIFNKFKEGWLLKSMEIAWFEFAKSVKITGDSAFVGYMHKGKFGWKVLSFEKGDRLYPHYDPITGEMNLFAREYTDYNEDGSAVTSWIEVWTDEYYYRLRKGLADKIDKLKVVVKGIFGQSGYEVIESKKHGFKSIPVSYHRDDNGACWSFSQEAIDNYEVASSRLAQSNHAFGTPIMYLKGEGVEVIGDTNNAVKTIAIPQDGEAGFLQRQDASQSYSAELSKLEDMIYTLSHAVKNIELKSGDTPSSSIRLLFHPAIEKAMNDAQEYNPALNKIVEIFRFGYGVEKECMFEFDELKMNVWIEPYIPQNASELITNLSIGVQNKFISKRTAAMRASIYTTNDEHERILKEMKEEQQEDVLSNLQQTLGSQIINSEAAQNGSVDSSIDDIEKQIVDPSKRNDTPLDKKDKFDGELNTGGRGRRGKAGRPNKSGKQWDENGNYPGRVNWDEWNKKH